MYWHLAGESLQAWANEQEHAGERLALTPEDLGLRITYLASALGTGEWVRLGCGAMSDDKADLSSPGGSAPPATGPGGWRVVEPLDEAECMELLASGRLARLVYTSRYGPTALPVTYRIDERSVVLGTWDPVLFDEDLRTGIEQAEYGVAVEADQIDVQAREGWFVLVRGAAHHLDTEAERAAFINAGLEPWVEGVPAHFIRVNPTSIWGNRTRPA